MTSLNGTTDGFNSGHPRRLYITTSAYHNDIYKYTTSRSTTTYVVSGTLTSLATLGTGTAANCPANRILRENGRRLNKDANPGLSTLLVGVYDSVSGLSGFIDPNSPRFAVYNGDKSVFQDNGVDPNGGLVDQGPPIYTRGLVTSTTGLTVATTTAGVTTTFFNASPTGITLTAGGLTQKVTASSTALGATATLDLSLGNVFYFSTIIPNSTLTVAFTVTNGAIGSVFYVALQAAATGPGTVSFTGTTGSSLIYVSGPVIFTAANPTVSPTLTASTRYFFVGTIVAA
jgi:hypothetical protein